MNFDELKNQWRKDSEPNQFDFDLNLSLKHSNNAIDKVRKNMRMDFWGFVSLIFIGFIVLFFLPYFIYVHPLISFILWGFFLLFLVLSSYFLFKFYRFYKKSYSLEYNLKDSLWWFYYELRSFVDFYYTFNVVVLTMGLSCGLSLGYIGGTLKFMQDQDNLVSKYMDKAGQFFGSFFLVFMVVFLIFCMIGLHYAVQYMYGKHLRQLKNSLDLLRDEN